MEIIRSSRSGYYGYRFNQRRPTKRSGKRALFIVFGFVFALLSSTYAVIAINKDVAAVTAETLNFTHQAEGVNISWPTTGQAAVGDLQDGVLASSGSPEAQKPIASITKLMTALAVLEKQPLKPGEQGSRFTVGPTDVANYQNYVAKLGSVMPVSNGQILTEYQVLQALLLVSANNLADSLVIWVFGSMQNYLTFVKEFTAKNGWSNTVINDASGFSPGSQSTPSDLIKIGQKALQNPVIAEIVAQKEAVIPNVGTIKNTNQLLADTDVVGIKTGTTDEAGSCLLFAVKYGPEKQYTMLAVITGQPNWSSAYRSARALRDSTLSNFKEIELLPAGSIVGNYKTPWGAGTNAIASAPLKVFGWVGKQYEVEITLSALTSQTNKDQVLGKANISGKTDGIDIVAESTVGQPNVLWRLANYW